MNFTEVTSIFRAFFESHKDYIGQTIEFVKQILSVFENDFEGRIYAWSILLAKDNNEF